MGWEIREGKLEIITKKIFPYGRVGGFFLPYICPIKLTALVNLFSPRIFWIYLSVKNFWTLARKHAYKGKCVPPKIAKICFLQIVVII